MASGESHSAECFRRDDVARATKGRRGSTIRGGSPTAPLTGVKEVKSIDPAELTGSGYIEVREWDLQFGKAYGWPNLILAMVFFAGLLLALRGHLKAGGPMMLGSFTVLLVLWSFFRHARPRNPITGKKLTPYLSTTPVPRNPDNPDSWPLVEMIYVDHDAKTYFRHVFLENEP